MDEDLIDIAVKRTDPSAPDLESAVLQRYGNKP